MARCILCGGRCYEDHLFCKYCYYKYRNTPITIQFDDEGIIDLVDDDEELFDQCFICGEEADGYFFCPSCYGKYKNKTIYLAVKNCQNVKVLDAPVSTPPLFSVRSQAKFEAAKKFKTEDGHTVRSPHEQTIDNLLYRTRIPHAYEKALPYNKDNGYPIIPDWFVPVIDNENGIYIEYYGVTHRRKYDRRRRRTQIVYDREDVPVISIEAEEIEDVQELENKIITELNDLAFKHYGVQRFIK